MKRIIVSLFTTFFTLLALANVAGACSSWGYQPEIPPSLRK
ncbi:MAG: cyclic lactone autoinducer peptide [Bacillota bacterium]|jgi:cyclic lactone autoinducer peptide